MNSPISLKQVPQTKLFGKNDVFVLFGELFGRGYASGLVNEARKAGMEIVGITVGRRDENNGLRPLNAEELAAAEANLGGRIINLPLMAGFDMDAPAGEPTPTDLLNKMTLKTWEQDKIANRIYKGRGERFMSSQSLIDSDLGKLILQNFDEVSANTFGHLIEGSTALRTRIEAEGGQVRYTAYGYHGTEILIDDRYQWQTYTNYTQGYAKMRLERIAQAAWDKGVKATVYNCPEIRTNSTDVFAGVELPLISLLHALKKEGGGVWAESQWQACRALLAEGVTLEDMLQKIADFHASEVMQPYRNFAAWPMPNSPAQADLQIGTSDAIVNMHKDRGALTTDLLSTLVLEATGTLILRESAAPTGPVLWLNHDIIARQLNQLHA